MSHSRENYFTIPVLGFFPSFTLITNVLSFSVQVHKTIMHIMETYPTAPSPPGRSFLTSFITNHLWSDNRYLILTAKHCLGLFKGFLWFLIFPCHLQLHFTHHNPSVTWQIFFSSYCRFFAVTSLPLDWIKEAALNLPLHLGFFFDMCGKYIFPLFSYDIWL